MRADIQVSPLTATAVWIAIVALGLRVRFLYGRRRRPPVPTLPSGWTGSSSEGALLLSLLLDSRSWIAERTDAVQLIDGLWFHCSASVEVDTKLRETLVPGCRWIPLEILPKTTTANVDIGDGDRNGAPVLRSLHQQRLAQEGLATLAEATLGRECSATTATAIRALVRSSPKDAHAAIRKWRRLALGGGLRPADKDVRILTDDSYSWTWQEPSQRVSSCSPTSSPARGRGS